MAKGAAQLKPNSGIIHGLKDQKATKGRGSTLNTAQLNIQGQGGVKVFGLTLSRLGSTTATHVEESLDTTGIQTSQGFDVVQKFHGGGRPSIGAKFTYGDMDIPSQCLKVDGTCGKESYRLPICSSQDMTMEGTFQPQEDKEKYYKYTFQCRRDIKGWFWMMPDPTPPLSDSAPNSAISSTPASASSSSPTSSASSSPGRKGQSNSISSSFSCMSLGKGVINGAVKRWFEKTCEQVFHFDIYINHSMKRIHKLAKQYPDGIAIGPEFEEPSVIRTEKIVNNDKVHDKVHKRRRCSAS